MCVFNLCFFFVPGLDNFLLEKEDPFNEKVTAVISSFLNTCASPICLVAHNGYVFDFPLLREEFRKFEDVRNGISCVSYFVLEFFNNIRLFINCKD